MPAVPPPDVSRRSRRRTAVAATLTALTGILLAATILSAFVRFELVDADRFAERAVSATGSVEVRERLAAHITDDVIAASDGDLISFRPLIQTAVTELIGSAPFRNVLRSAIADLHRTVVAGRTDTTTVLLSDIGVLITAAVSEISPGISDAIPADLDSGMAVGSLPSDLSSPIETAREISGFFLPLLLATIASALLAILIARPRRRAVGWLAIAMILAGLAVTVIGYFGQSALTGSVPGGITGDILDPIIGEFAAALRTEALTVVGIGVILAAALRAWIRPVDLRARLNDIWERATRPAGSPRGEAVRAIGMIVAGVLLIWQRDWIWEMVMILAGAALALIGLEQIFRLLAPPPGPEPEAPARPRRRLFGGRAGRAAAITGAGLIALILLGSGIFATGNITPPKLVNSGRCNGHRVLCSRTVDRVAFATTHNSMAAADTPDWLFAQQERDISGQLEDGIRGLMLDAHFGRRVSDGVRTEMDRGRLNRELQKLFGVDGAAAAERIRDRLVGGGTPGPREVWLCHTVCEVGAVSMRESLADIRNFLVENPDEVVVVAVQDEDVPPAAIAEEFRASGLLQHVYRRSLDDGFPTLGEMVRANRRVLVFAENETDPAIGWYHPAFKYIQETPYHFTSPQQMSCRKNRGPEDAPLFLINNWIDTSPTPRPSNARIVNSNPALWDRVTECERERNAFPNFVAVDFYRQGDLFEVIDRLNGVR